jgi:osmotically inducible lipoprotein OsmB
MILFSKQRRSMKNIKMIMFAGMLTTLALLTGCQSMEGHEGAIIGGAAGAAGGALIGSAAAGSGNRGTGALIGGAIGGVAGGVAGDQLHDKKNR